MPELPEVETVVRTLEKEIKGKTITDVLVLHKNIIDNLDVDVFCHLLVGEKFSEFKRRGKYLIFELTKYNLVVHLRMEGKFFINDLEDSIDKHTHVIFTFNDGKQLRYNDVRKFGKMYLYSKLDSMTCLDGLGLEFHDSEMSVDYLYNLTKGSRLNLKQFLLDQHLVLGIGNIYADEICFLMRKHPTSLVSEFDKKDLESLLSSAITVLDKAIEAGGTTIRSYTSSLGVTGRFQQELMVHQQEGKACKICGYTIVKDRVAGRGTYYCPNCQRKSYHFIGLTGQMGAGKSTAIKLFKENDFNVIDCDKIVDNLLKENNILDSVSSILNIKFTDNHKGNKLSIANVIFSDELLKDEYLAYLYPIVMNEVFKSEKAYNIVEIQKLFESNLEKYFDTTIAIVCDDKIVRERLLARGTTILEIKRRKQSSNAYFRNKAIFIIDNSYDFNYLKQQVNKLSKILKG